MSKHDMVISEGKPLPMAPDAVQKTVSRMIDEGEILAVIVQMPSGDIAVQVFGPPSMGVVEILESAVRDFRNVVERAQ